MAVENRRDKRYALNSIDVTVNGTVGKITDISARGVLVSDVKGDFGLDDPCKVSFTVPMYGDITEYIVVGTVIRRIVEVVGIGFEVPSNTWPSGLTQLSVIESEED